ncbi:MAG TPA: sodium:proton antiporter [Pirellulales bacterium]|jgi:Na+/H+ antiporter NhaD/arsenite permease-like protein|nr:sodium:proton antiporter [Pirellulales bacterium]
MLPGIESSSHRPVVWAIAVLVIGYGLAALAGLPQEASNQLEAARIGDKGQKTGEGDEGKRGRGDSANGQRKTQVKHGAHGADQPAAPTLTPPPFWTVVPFGLLLAVIAVLPLSQRTHHWWEGNLHKLFVAGGLASLVLAYYGFAHPHPIERHFLGHALVARPEGALFAWEHASTVLANAILQDFVPFIILLFSLYTISGGLRIAGDLPAHPITNTLFLAAGAGLASFVGTTGAAMILIRPLLETNRERKHVRHTVVFFIFVACNCGGCLLPLGDPPLFLGYLQGVPFFWTLSLWKAWLLVNGCLLGIYYTWDRWLCYPHEEPRDRARDEARVHRLHFAGLWPNAALLLAVVPAAALLDAGQTVPGTDWRPWLYLRECVLLTLTALSLALGPESVRRQNRFDFVAIVEVAALFLGIFICVQPALAIAGARGPQLGIDSAAKFFWTTGILSSVLDNAPTYLVFFETAKAVGAGGNDVAGVGVRDDLLAAISLGAVFMGATTYIGNGPNFMVRSIAERAGVRMPSFLGYLAISGVVLVPLFALVTLLFFR